MLWPRYFFLEQRHFTNNVVKTIGVSDGELVKLNRLFVGSVRHQPVKRSRSKPVQQSSIAVNTLSGVIGNAYIRAPQALYMALAIAPAPPHMPSSPIPLA